MKTFEEDFAPSSLTDRPNPIEVQKASAPTVESTTAHQQKQGVPSVGMPIPLQQTSAEATSSSSHQQKDLLNVPVAAAQHVSTEDGSTSAVPKLDTDKNRPV